MVNSKNSAIGYFYAVGAYLIWGTFPIIVAAASFATPLEILLWRLVFGFLFAFVLVLMLGNLLTLKDFLKIPGKLKWTALAAISIFINWTIYVLAIINQHVIESSLGYFINPLVTILFAVLFLGEKLRPTQWGALALAIAAVIVLTFDFGRPPWIAFLLALSFATYSLAKKKLGGAISALNGFTLEAGMLLPFAAVIGIVLANTGGVEFGRAGFGPSLILIGFGVITAIPLIMFGAAASRIPLTMLGFIQYLTPTVIFVLGLTYFGEEFPPARWLGFFMIWACLAILGLDAIKNTVRVP